MEASRGLLGVLGGVFLGLELASKTLILSEIGVRPMEERRDMVAVDGRSLRVVRMTFPPIYMLQSSDSQLGGC